MIDSKFIPLANYLRKTNSKYIELSFSEIESVLGFVLCPSARIYNAYWHISKTHMLPLVCEEAGYRIDSVDIFNEKVRFAKI